LLVGDLFFRNCHDRSTCASE